MIEKFQDSEAITWRINYLKNNVIRSSHNETGEFRPISQEEAENNKHKAVYVQVLHENKRK